MTEEIRPKCVQSHRVERISLGLGMQPFSVWDTHLIEQTKAEIQAGCACTCFCFGEMFETGDTSDLGFWSTCILGLGPVYLREILSPFVCVCVICVYVHACIWRPEVDFRSSFVISVLRHELSSNLEHISLGRPAGQQARVPFATLHCKFVPTQPLFTSGATDQTQVLGPVQRALYWLGHLSGPDSDCGQFYEVGFGILPLWHPRSRSPKFWIRNAWPIPQLSNVPSVVTVNVFS